MVDVLIATCLCYFLRSRMNECTTAGIKRVLDTLVLYAVENGTLTSVGTIVSMVCVSKLVLVQSDQANISYILVA